MSDVVTVVIPSDPRELGPDATSDDVDRYAEEFAAHLAERFDVHVLVRAAPTPRAYVEPGPHGELAEAILGYLEGMPASARRDLAAEDGRRGARGDR